MTNQPTSDTVAEVPADDAVSRPEIDPAKLPALPPSSAKVWEKRIDPRRWYIFGCSAAVIILVVVMVTAYFGLKKKVWATFDDMQAAVERSILVDVPPAQRERLESNLRAFRNHVESSDDPYPAIGRFVSFSRELVADWAVDTNEVESLNMMLEGEIQGEAE